MKKTLLLLLPFLLLLAGCAGLPPGETETTRDILELSVPVNLSEPAYSRYWDTWPSPEGIPLFLGVSRRLDDRGDEEDRALDTAALSAAMYLQVEGLSRFYVENTSQGQGYSGDFQYRADEDLAGRLREELEVVSRLQDHQGTYLIVRYPGGSSLSLPGFGLPGGNPPEWTRTLPRLPGYLVSLGTAQRRQYTVDSVTAADLQALEEMVKTISLQMSGQRNTLESNRGIGTVQSSLEVARATVRGFYILARWQSPDGSLFYSLGICPVNQN